jgi:hypothetical protein
VLEAQNFSNLTHRQSLGWHGAPRCCSGERAVGWRPPVVRPVILRGVAAFIGIGGRNLEASVRSRNTDNGAPPQRDLIEAGLN